MALIYSISHVSINAEGYKLAYSHPTVGSISPNLNHWMKRYCNYFTSHVSINLDKVFINILTKPLDQFHHNLNR